MNNYILSIVTICFNDLDGLKTTERSISKIPKLVDCSEWIVIDGGSTDGTLSYLDNNQTVDNFLSESDDGIYDAMNKGINLANGEFIIFMNSGDEFIAFNKVLQMLQTKKFDVITANSIVTSRNFRMIRKTRGKKYILHGNPAVHQSMIYRGSICKEVLYDKKFLICGDYAFTSEFYKRDAKFGECDETLSKFTLGGVSTTKWPLLISEAAYVQREILGLPRFFIFISKIKRLIGVIISFVIYKVKF